jgi:glutaryl-CoA dehydrogenase
MDSPPEVAELYRLDDSLSEPERAVREVVARLVQSEVLPVIGRHFRAGTFPADVVPRLGELGVLGANLSGYGCAGLSNVAYGLAMQELERGDSGLRSFASVQTSLVMWPIHRYGSEAQKQRWLPRLARGEAIGCFGLTETEAGSDPASLRTRAARTKGGYLLNGSKAWITNGALAHLALVWAKTDDGGPESVRGFLVDTTTKGFGAREIPGKFSLRASSTAELSLVDVRVEESDVLPGVQGLKGPLSCLNQARAGIAFSVTGAAIACFEGARAHALARQQFGRPIAAFQLTQAKLADMLERIVLAQTLGLHLLRQKDAGHASPTLVSLAKRANVRAALTTAREARSIYGASGITDDTPPIRHLLNLESVYTYEGTHEVHTLVLGKAITGIDAFS